MKKQFVHPLLIDSQTPFLLLEVFSFAFSCLSCLLYHIFDIIWMKAVQDLPEVVALRQTQFIVSCWIRQMVSNVGKQYSLLINMLYCKLWPIWNGSSWNVFCM